MDSSEAQSTTEMFKDMLNQKRNLLFSKLTSFESDVSLYTQDILLRVDKCCMVLSLWAMALVGIGTDK